MSQRDPAHEVFTNPYILSIIKSHRNNIQPLLKNNAKMKQFLQSIAPRGNTRSIAYVSCPEQEQNYPTKIKYTCQNYTEINMYPKMLM